MLVEVFVSRVLSRSLCFLVLIFHVRFGTGSHELLPSFVEPLVHDPFGSHKNRTGGVSRAKVAVSVVFEVVPEGSRARPRPQLHAEVHLSLIHI